MVWCIKHGAGYPYGSEQSRVSWNNFKNAVFPTRDLPDNRRYRGAAEIPKPIVLDRFVTEGEIKRTKNGPKKTGAGGDDTDKIDRVKNHFTEDPNCSLRDGSDLLGVRTLCA